MYLCVGCHSMDICNTPIDCVRYEGVQDLDIKQATFNEKDKYYKKDFHSCKFRIPEDFEADLSRTTSGQYLQKSLTLPPFTPIINRDSSRFQL